MSIKQLPAYPHCEHVGRWSRHRLAHSGIVWLKPVRLREVAA